MTELWPCTVDTKGKRLAQGGGGAILYPTERLAAHLTITLQKIFSLRKYQGKSTTFLVAMLNIIKDM